jgi:hypothetical protein
MSLPHLLLSASLLYKIQIKAPFYKWHLVHANDDSDEKIQGDGTVILASKLVIYKIRTQ